MRGLGLATYIEACGIAPSAVAGALGARAGLYESAEVRVHPTGSVTILTGSHSHGQGHETTFSQLVADGLGIPIENVKVIHGDTDKIPFGMGTYGSRSLAVGGSAIVKAMDKVVAKGHKMPPICSKPPRPMSSSRTASSPLPAPTGRRLWPRWL